MEMKMKIGASLPISFLHIKIRGTIRTRKV